MLGTHPDDVIMPPAGLLPAETVQVIVDWVAGGAPER